ncbi:winged helix-turn-helix transcriptional regulator [Megasphaera hominis]|jgi:DNA-binding HxlR family transcriptional regulator|uniref:Helix-turn-helix transcriptional regulator n=1 Tax=Megasphaera hominis TaxID=159836 RepID=A0ABR6VGL3_9FIRM|nr:helix-turn-helix domain-containing protein [Megasphaera hominis]MBC3536442.1 helix-turn-helix transcriptional regulator [Megasphaera hominis]
MNHKTDLFHCPVEAVLSLISGKYKCIILWHLMEGTQRYSELRRFVPQATPKMLTQQLRELEADGIVVRKVYPVVPPKTEYSLTDYGRTLSPIVQAMCDWGKKYMSDRIEKAE